LSTHILIKDRIDMKKFYIAPSIKVYGVEMEKSVLSSSSEGSSWNSGNVTNPGCNTPTLEDLEKSDRTDVCPLPPK